MENKKLLYIDAGTRPLKESRTRQLCQDFLTEFTKIHPEYTVRHLILAEENLKPNIQEDIALRDRLLKEGQLHAPVFAYSHEFAQADHILIGAPYWDLSFPAILKIYLEKVCIADIAFKYTPNGVHPLCRAKQLTYATACGGYIGEYDCGADYVRGLCKALLGIPRVETASAEGLDIEGMDVPAIMTAASEHIRHIARTSR